jgi:hypothetical protein
MKTTHSHRFFLRVSARSESGEWGVRGCDVGVSCGRYDVIYLKKSLQCQLKQYITANKRRC